jgi:hypothetical protein
MRAICNFLHNTLEAVLQERAHALSQLSFTPKRLIITLGEGDIDVRKST